MPRAINSKISSISLPNIFFDLDGVLVDTTERSYRLYRDILKKHGRKPLVKEKYLSFKQNHFSIEKILTATYSEDLNQTFIKEWNKAVETEPYLKYDKLFPRIKALLNSLRKEYNLYLITLRKSRKELYWELDRLGIKPAFKKILIATEKTKRHEGKIEVLRKFAKVGDIITGDSETDIRAGKKLGLVTIAVKGGWRSSYRLRRESPDYLIDHQNIPSLLAKLLKRR